VALTAPQLRNKLIRALTGAVGRRLETDEQIREYVEGLDFATSGTFGGHSPCVQIELDTDEYLVCDMGSGLRPFGHDALKRRAGRGGTYHILVSHSHWDHIMGFPFFAPAYIPGNRILIYGCHENLQEAIRRQQEPPSFPVTLDVMRGEIQFVQLAANRTHEIAGCRVTPKIQHHSGDSYGYRIERDGKAVVYTTDTEHKLDDYAQTQAFVEFFRDADLVIFDSMYSLAEAMSVKEDWGHSSNVIGVELCQMARAKKLCLFHHEPVFDDDRLTAILEETQRFEKITREGHAVEVVSAYDGLELAL
jgi:phosphoribosyl 1,2-cyclic phosphodiesterase